MILDDLLELAQPFRDPIRSSGRGYRHEVETRLDVSARHLSTVELGRQLEPCWRRDNEAIRTHLPTDHGTIVTAAQTLVFGGAQACLELCASAVVHWHGRPAANDRDFDLGDLRSSALNKAGLTLDSWAVAWRDRTRGDSRFAIWDRDRGAQIHRIVRRSSTVFVGSAPTSQSWLSASDSIDPNDPVEDVYETVLNFTREAWMEFWSALANNP